MFVELIAVAVIIVISFAAPNGVERIRRRLSPLWCRLSRHHIVCLMVVTAMVGLICVGFASIVGMPLPFVHDEFSYLLGADTFASGRLTNPTHPMWEHFETFHVIHQPTYQTKYPPGQSLVLAAGQILGHPIYGVWISLALAVGATYWMLLGWLPARWALLGGILCCLNPGLIRYWGETYWGGAVAMLGGALVFGTLPRIMHGKSVFASLTLALGLIVLANSRPYEGLLASLPVAGVLIVWMFVHCRQDAMKIVGRVVAPISGVLLVGFLAMGCYNNAVTGTPWRMPYQAWQTTYGGTSLTSLLLSESASSSALKADRNRRLIDGNEESLQEDNSTVKKITTAWLFFLRPALSIPFVAALISLTGRRHRFVLLTLLLVTFAVFLAGTSGHPHYLAPITCLVLLTAINGLRLLFVSRRLPSLVGRAFVTLLLPVVILSFVATVINWSRMPNAVEFAFQRRAIEERLRRDADKHLIVVRYSPTHNIYHEWIYNEADIDGAKIVWARELDAARNVKLMEYFGNHRVWLLEADVEPPQMIPHRRSKSSAADSNR